jgi:hypothetical protein
MIKVGYTDIPIQTIEDDTFDVSVYIKSLAKFVTTCQTPMTVAIQGDWGSGKTSFMNVIRNEVCGDVMPIWFNTWQFSQFQMQGSLSVTFLKQLFSQISVDKSAGVLQSIGRGLSAVSKGLAVAAVERTLGGSAAGSLSERLSEDDALSPAEEIRVLREQLELSVRKRVEHEKKDRIVFFIDDLDRIPPELAVEILELLKLFLDVPKTVFVLAVDYEVVIAGIERKFGSKIDPEKGRSFFDKIIQLPFSVPTSHYNITKYIHGLLAAMDLQETDEKITYEDLVRNSIGCNPRSIKRVFNAFYLLSTVAELNGVYADRDKRLVARRRKILFAILTMQLAFEPLYELFIREADNISDEFFRGLTVDAMRTEDRYAATRRYVKSDLDVYLSRFADFADILYQVLQLDDDTDNLSELEVDNFKQVLIASSITATSSVAISARGTRQLDTSKFMFDGTALGKGRLVLAVVKKHVAEHPGLTAADLEAAFPKTCQGSAGVFSTLEVAAELFGKSGRRRHFLNPEETIQLDDCVIAVSNQWGIGNLDRFMQRARQLGYNIGRA